MDDLTTVLPVLLTERLRLRLLDSSFAEAVTNYLLRSREFAQPWNPIAPEGFFTVAWQRDRLDFDLSEYQAGRMVRFWMFLRDDPSRVIGHIALSNIVRGALQGCFVGYGIDSAEGGKGLMTEGVKAVAAYAFTELNLHRLEANIIPRNIRSIRVAEKAGFQREGLSPRYLFINGAWEDHYRYGLIRDNT